MATGFVPVATLSIQPTLVVVEQIRPPRSLADLTTILKTKGDKGSYGAAFRARESSALSTKRWRVCGWWKCSIASRDWINDLNRGDLDFAIIDAVSGVGLAKEGRFRILVGSADQRSSSLPDVPTMKEGGIDLSVPGWWAIFCADRRANADR